ncbi:hypothetical protein EGW08_006871, partial [Elysia chlorotica]
MAYLYAWTLVLATVLGLSLSQDLFYFNVKPENTDAVEGSETKLFCDVSDRRHIAFHWTQQGKPLQNTSRKYQEDSNLRILRVMRGEDEGPFNCIATNVTTEFSMESQEAILTILWIDEKSSVVLKRPRKEEITMGSDVLLKCQISGNPTPKIYWYRNDYRVFPVNSNVQENGQRLRLSNISAEQNGVYSCKAENTAGTVESSNNFIINVKEPGFPHLQEDQFSPYQLALKHEPARLNCPFEDAARIDWFTEHAKLPSPSN